MIVAAVGTAAQEFMANEWPSWTKHTARHGKEESCGVPKFRARSSLRGKNRIRRARKGYRCAFLVG